MHGVSEPWSFGKHPWTRRPHPMEPVLEAPLVVSRFVRTELDSGLNSWVLAGSKRADARLHPCPIPWGDRHRLTPAVPEHMIASPL